MHDPAVIDRFMKFVHPEPNSGCWLWLGTWCPKGYGTFYFRKRSFKAHRASWTLFRSEIPEGLYICHRCDNPPCVNPDHLFCGTHLDNNRDMMMKGRHADFPGSMNGNAIATEHDIIAIRQLAKRGWTPKYIAQHFDIGIDNIYKIIRGDVWKHVPTE